MFNVSQMQNNNIITDLVDKLFRSTKEKQQHGITGWCKMQFLHIMAMNAILMKPANTEQEEDK